MTDARPSPSPDRRDALRSLGIAAAGMTLINRAVSAEQTPGTQVADRSSSIRIYEHSGNPVDIARMVNAIQAARENVGRDGAVMFDAHSAAHASISALT